MQSTCVLPKKMGEVGIIQTVQDNMKLFRKWQIAGVVQARDLYEKLIYPSTADYKVIVSVGGVPGSDVTINDVKVAEEFGANQFSKWKGTL
jgi:hypothetical protein